MYEASIVKCPQCNRPFEIRMFSMYSGLGPAAVQCSKCETKIDTGRTEWMDMSNGQLLFFTVVSLIYCGMLGLIGGNFLDAAYQLQQRVPVVGNLRFSSSSFQHGAVACGVAAALIQLYRVVRSMIRSKSGRKMKTRDFWLGLEMNMQFKCLAALVLIWLLAKVMYAE